MITFNLIYPDQSDIGFKAIIFPDGQPHLKLDVASMDALGKNQPIRILSRISNANDLMMVLLAKNTLDYQEFQHVELHISYLLAARMDRVMLEGEPFSLKVLATMINSGNFKKVIIFDPHSEVSTAVIERSYAVSNHDFVKDALAHYFTQHNPASYCLVSPDAGALKKIHKLAQYLNVDKVVECMKERDLKTGALTNFKTTSENLQGFTCFIVDDICDGGGTFAGTAAMLMDKGATKVVLIVSHGIFSKGTTIGNISDIYTTDSYKTVEQVNCFRIDQYLK
jgi:ribose-phosphate pyrophosphokinase